MIRTGRLVLRAPRETDLEALHAVFSDPRAMRYWSHPAHTELATTGEVLRKMIAAHAATGLEFVLVHRGAVIGKAGMWRTGEIGYILGPDHWGKGLAGEALAAILAEAFRRDPELAAITAEIDPRNLASARLLARLGFHETGRAARTWEIAGNWSDSAWWQLDRGGCAAPAKT